VRRMGLLLGLGAVAMGLSAPATVATSDPFGGVATDHFPKPKRGKGQNNKRGKGKRSPPKSRPNRLTISKRVRRKHRRAA
jgi:hypothetical protein